MSKTLEVRGLRKVYEGHGRSDPRFTRLRSHLYGQIQQAKRGGGQVASPSSGRARGAPAAPGA